MVARKPLVIMVFNETIYFYYKTGKNFELGDISIAGLISDGKILDIHVFAEKISQFIKDNHIKQKKARLILKTSECIIRFATLPYVSGHDLEGLVFNNINDYFPVSTAGYAISYKVLPGKTKQTEIMLAALSEEISAPYISILSEIGIKLERIDVFQNSALNLFDSEETVLLILLQPNKLTVMITEKGVPKAARDIHEPSAEHTLDEINRLIAFYGINQNAKIYAPAAEYSQIAEYVSGIEIHPIDFLQLMKESITQ